MRFTLSVAMLLAVAGSGWAKNPPAQTGVLLRMESTSCGSHEKDGKTVAGQLLGTGGEHKKTNEVLCQEYVLETARVTYRIRPRDDKHAELLPLGETAEFRVEKNEIKLRVPETNQKEREYIVVSMTLRDEPSSRRAAYDDRDRE
jgi:hypothetical protein